jgi:hypothetical protein
MFKDMFNKLLKKRNHIFYEILLECKNYLEKNNSESDIKNLESKISFLNNKKDKLLELVMDEYLSKDDYKKQVDLINEDLSIYQNKKFELKNNKKDKNYIENKINEIMNSLEKCVEDKKCFSNIFNELVESIYVYKVDIENNKKIKLDILFKSGELISASSNDLGKKYHLMDAYTTSNGGICGS